MQLNQEFSRALNEDEVARALGVSTSALRSWRLRGRGPRFLKLGRAVRYLAQDVEVFIEASGIQPAPKSHRKTRAE